LFVVKLLEQVPQEEERYAFGGGRGSRGRRDLSFEESAEESEEESEVVEENEESDEDHWHDLMEVGIGDYDRDDRSDA
jgi:hypothetical protein